MTEEEYYTVEELAHLLKVHPETVKRRLRQGKLPGKRLGDTGSWRIGKREFHDFMKKPKDM